MKILHLLSQRPDSTGSGIYLQAMLEQAASRGHTNALIAAGDAEDPPDIYRLKAEPNRLVHFNTGNLNFALPGMSDVMPYPSSRFQDLDDEQLAEYERSFLSTAIELIRQFKPDLIHSHHLWLLSSLIKTHFPATPMTVSCHGSDLRQFQLCPHLQERAASGCRTIEKIFALTTHQKRAITQLYGVPEKAISIAGAGFNDSIFNLQRRHPPEIPTFLYCGKLSRSKGVPMLLQALAKINRREWHLHLVGSGSGQEFETCLALAQKLGDRVTVHGSIQQQELADLLRSTHIFILPSLYEGLPLVILEALACGCKVIATSLPGCLEIGRCIDESLISYVPLPKLFNIDTLYPEDEENFIHNLEGAILSSLDTAVSSNISPQTIKESLAPFTWQNIFLEIEKQYLSLIS